MARQPRARLAWLVPAVVTGSLLPCFVIALRAAFGVYGPNPIASAMNQLGLLALALLMLTLACTPLRLLSGWTWPARVRRALGLLAFFVALAHFLVYLLLDQGLALHAIFDDLAERPFILVGFVALVLLIPLALTSTKRAVSRLGYVTWSRLHRLVYLVSVLGVVHFFLRVKKDVSLPFVYALVLLLLFSVRWLARWARQRSRLRATP